MAAPRKKAPEKSELRKMRSITITVEASESNLQRLAAFMLFADRLDEDIRYTDDGPLPWEEPAPEPRPLAQTIDFNVVKRSIVAQLEKYVAKYGRDDALQLIRSFGAEKITLLPESQLLPLYEALVAALPAEPKNET